MINFPVFDRLDILNYGLYPGIHGLEPGLHIQFCPGLTLVLGANGLGKTTLVRIIFRLLTGPFDIPRLENRRDLGTASLETTPLSTARCKTFANRVMDGADTATACLSFHIGQHTVIIKRRLSELDLTQLEIDGQVIPIDEEKIYQDRIIDLAGVSSFGDWILLLRFLVFCFEDRRALVWDPSAQRQILRILLLPVSEARHWAEDEREILELDSHMRNLRAAVGREERILTANEAKLETENDLRDELDKLLLRQETDTEWCERLEDELPEIDAARRQARLRVLTSEQERETHSRAIERIKLAAISTQFPSGSETAQYILAQLLTNQICIACGSYVPEVAVDYASRIEHAQCVVCGTDIADLGTVSSSDVNESSSEAAQATTHLRHIEANLEEARRALREIEADYQSRVVQISELRKRINDQSRRIDFIVKRLPPEEVEIHKQRSQLTLMHDRVDELKRQLDSKQELFKVFIEKVNREIAKSKEAIKTTFDRYAKGFLLEQCQLVWSLQRARVGQTGESLSFPAFELDMTGVDFPSPVRRSGPEQVSESQREFIDLAFRMALMTVATSGGSSLVMDAPESSLDAVFAPRAATVFSRFAEPTLGNRLIITSNLVEGQLIPSLIESIPQDDRAMRVVDLVKIAAPTAAVREQRIEYERILNRLLAAPYAKGIIDDGE